MTGLDGNSKLLFRRINISAAYLGNLELPMYNVLITNDCKVKTSIIGMDVLQFLDIRQLGGTRVLSLRRSSLHNTGLDVTQNNYVTTLEKALLDHGYHQHKDKILSLLPTTINMSYAEYLSLIEKILRSIN